MSESDPSQLPLVPTGSATLADSEHWFQSEVHAHDGQLKSYLKGKYPKVRDIDDVVQESYLRVWRAKAIQPIHSAKSFLFQVARHVALDLIRKDKNSLIISSGDFDSLAVLDDELGVVEALSEREKVSLFADAIVALPARIREAIILHKFQRLPQAEVAARLGVTLKTVEHLVARGIVLCREYLRKRGH